mgnify:CR=1 FL=1
MSEPAQGDRGNTGDDAGRRLAAAYDAHGASLYRLALMILADRSAAEDAVQQAFAKLAGMDDRAAHLASIHGYLRSAVRNECYRMLARGRVRVRHELAASLLETVDPDTDLAEHREAVGRALSRLPPEQREVVHMKVYEQMTFHQIAEELKVSINTAASRWRYAVEKLRVALAAYGCDEVHDDRER